MNFKIIVLFLGLLFVLSVSPASAIDLDNITADNAVSETIFIDHDVSLTPNNQSVISATNKNTIFNVSSNATLNLSNLNLTNGQGVNGGAIYNKGVLILNNCIFINNKATLGGAIYNEGVLVLNNCIFINNGASSGGAIYNNGTMVLNNCTFKSNTASVSGGAIYTLQDNLNIKNSVFTENYVKIKNGEVYGGAIANYGNNLTVDNCSFVKNHVFNTYWYGNGEMFGGAIYNSGNNLLVKNSRFDRNYIYGYTDSGHKNVDWSDKYGAAVYSTGSVSTFMNNEFDSNEIYSMLSSYISTKIYMSNKGIGSAIVAYNKVVIINNTFFNNSAAAPPIFIMKGEGCIILSNLFFNNNARSEAQSMTIRGNNLVISGNTFYRNENATDKGYFADWEVYEILLDGGVNSTVSYNYFENSNGIHYLNAVGPDKTANLTIKNNIFNNSMNSISIEHGNNVDVDSNIFINSTHAVDTYTGQYINIKNNYFYGGGTDDGSSRGYLDINSHFTVISGNVFRKLGNDNSRGPIIAIKVRDNITIEGNSFTENNVGKGSIIYSLFGGYYYIDGRTDVSGPLGTVDVKHNYFANNTLNDGAIFDLTASKINIEQNIIENNDGLIILSNDTIYKHQYVNFTDNQIKDFSGDIRDYSYFLNPNNLVRYDNNKEYTGDSSSFLDKVLGFFQDLRDQYFNKGKPVEVPDKTDVNKNTTNSSSEIPKDGSIDSAIESVIDSDMGITVADSYSSQNMNSPSQAQASAEESSSSASDSSSKSYEIEKPNASKDISNNDNLIKVAVVVVAIFALLAYGYKKR